MALLIWMFYLTLVCQVILPDRVDQTIILKLSSWRASLIEKRLLQQGIQAFEQTPPKTQGKFETIDNQCPLLSGIAELANDA